jgi:hypothetical protein
LSAGVGFWLAELSCVFSMSLEILLWVKTDEIERNVAVSTHQKAADDNRQLNVAKTQRARTADSASKARYFLCSSQVPHLRLR